MGNSCACDIAFNQSDLFRTEFSTKPLKATLIGSSADQEDIITLNSTLHSSDFSSKFFGTPRKSLSQSLVHLTKSQSLQLSPVPAFSSLQHATAPPEKLLFEGELEKYKPGVSQKYAARWCKLTSSTFSYFKSQWSAACYNSPLFSIPLEQIKKIKVIQNRIQKKNPEFFEFEICSLNEDELIKLSRSSKGFSKMATGREFSTSSWTVRQVEWFIGEKRLLFGTKSIDTFRLWVKQFEKILRVKKPYNPCG